MRVLWISSLIGVCLWGDSRLLFEAVSEAGAPVTVVEASVAMYAASARPGLAKMLHQAGISEHTSEAFPEMDQRVVQLLVKAAEDPNVRFENGETVLMRAARMGSEEGVELLLDKGADLQLRDHRGRTALDHALHARHPLVVELLMAAGAIDSSTRAASVVREPVIDLR